MEKNWWPYILAGESVFFLFFWLINPYLAWLLTVVLAPIFMAVFLISKISEWIEKSNVHGSFFSFMFWMGFIPLVWALIFCWLDDFAFSWMK
ncbi:MAG: hypothetical protein IPN79_03990 [Saprospiraceae bacterium]|nr:hypothetical protein [Saprospiraceae bacterium]